MLQIQVQIIITKVLLEISMFINRIIPLSNGNYLMWGADYVNGLVELFDGYNNLKLGNYYAYHGPPDGPPPYPAFGDCIKEVNVIDDNLFHVKFVTCPISFFPIRLNAETAENPIIDVYANTNSSQSGRKPFLNVSPTGPNPIEEKQYSAKVWLNEPDAFQINDKYFVSRHFEVSPIATTPDITANVKLYFTQAEFDSYNSLTSNQLKLPTGQNDTAGKHNLQIVKYAGTSSTNYGLPDSYAGSQTIINPKDTDIIWNGSMWEVGFNVTGFSGFFVSTEFEMPLPSKLESFTVKNIGNENELNWQTSKEINTQSFQIERSIDALKFEKIGEVIANNNEKNNYQFIDKSPKNYSTIYYRLKMNDLDGSYTFSKIISIANKAQSISITPNPVTDKLTVNFGDNDKYLNSNCKLLNSLGQLIKEFKIMKPSMELDLFELPTGIYYLVLNDGNKIKFLKN
jgi:Secretion system C-terminal sorting domain